ncbi:LysR substrate-binding domain-containing protein [Chitinasiproducens palmae]|uniref:DNA-binding transcriptional regulator, LysR family n=1 Tax=Chitinasiproducens palmae TaxID=1770053 RepID=A0A1H2PT43_9BURK|nr:LysR substrate-binding domain-containing protein [Chitinasiproducens palmae]SDV50245.1 DNA-binding transcriptional regulator, LysR family [Chitinasiproducens palmae]
MKRSIGRAIPSSDSLIIFDTCVRLMNFTHAGNALGLTQSAVSRQILDLEQFLNVALFVRAGRNLSLTEAGERYWKSVTPLLDELEAATVGIQMRQTLANSVNLSVAGSFCNRWLIPHLPQFLAQHPGILVNVTSRVGPIDLARSQYDAAIINSASAPRGSPTVRLFPLRLAAYAAPRLVCADTPLSADALSRLPLLHLREIPNGWQAYLSAMGLNDTHPPAAGNYSLLLLSCEAALAGLGAALLPAEFVSDDVKAGRLVRLSEVEIWTPFFYWLAWQETLSDSPALQAFKTWLLACCDQREH